MFTTEYGITIVNFSVKNFNAYRPKPFCFTRYTELSSIIFKLFEGHEVLSDYFIHYDDIKEFVEANKEGLADWLHDRSAAVVLSLELPKQDGVEDRPTVNFWNIVQDDGHRNKGFGWNGHDYSNLWIECNDITAKVDAELKDLESKTKDELIDLVMYARYKVLDEYDAQDN